MYPALVSKPYNLCKLEGPYNNEVIVLQDDESTESSVEFQPYWTPEKLRHFIGNKAQPQVPIPSQETRNVPTVSLSIVPINA